VKGKKQRLPLPAVIALIVVAGLAVAAAGFFLIVNPQRAKATELENEIASVQLQIDANFAAAARAGKTKPIRSADLFRLSKAMPDRADMSGVLLELNRVAADSGITFESIAPQTSVPVSGYQAMPIQLAFNGNFYNLADFLYRLRNLVAVGPTGDLAASGRLFAIDTLDFSEAADGFPEITATLVVDAFVYGTGVPATATPATTTATTTALRRR
jgi:hypothetical protein